MSKSYQPRGFLVLIGSALLIAVAACTSTSPTVYTFTLPPTTPIVATTPPLQTATQPPTSQVPEAKLSSIAVTPGSPSLQVGLVLQLAATGTYSDGSTADISDLVTWSSSNPNVATISSSGLATAVASGNTNVMASLAGMSSPPVTLTVSQ